MELLLPYIEADVAFRMCGSPEIIATQSIWLQQLDGIDRQQLAISNYILNPTDLAYAFGDAYAEIMMDTKILKEKAMEQGSPHNIAVADIMTAITLGQLTDAWNMIPWSEALLGNENTQPSYDSQESIYTVIQQLLDEAITYLSAEDPYGIKGDYYYNGDPAQWLKAAYALKARYYLHLSKRWGNASYEQALSVIDMAFSGNGDDLQFNYGTGESESNPLYQFMIQKDNVRMGGYFIDMLIEREDPRLEVFAYPDETGDYVGSFPGQTNVAASTPGEAVSDPDSPTLLITYVELLFIKAEALYKTGSAADEVRTALLDAVSASLDKFGLSEEGWLDDLQAYVASLEGEALFEEIMIQKYIATFYQPEAFHSWRRTGYPIIPPNPAGQTSEIPRRFPYPITEMVWNPNIPTGVKITDRVWWDE
jgi:hypothetical protein